MGGILFQRRTSISPVNESRSGCPKRHDGDWRFFLWRGAAVSPREGWGEGDRPADDLLTHGNTRQSRRHQGKANVVFCDGHVESPTLKYLFEDTGDVALARWNRDHLPHRERLSP
ncbi:MAG: H-X9-DG-CTERM domain-containing protein [Verrucomicrobiota bacterium]